MSAGPSTPNPVAVGESITGNFSIQNTSPKGGTPPGTGDPGDCKTIQIVPGTPVSAVYGCGNLFSGFPELCPAANADPGIFALPTVGSVLAGAAACAGSTFTVSAIDPEGQLTLTVGGATITLTALSYGGTACTFSFSSSVLKEPTIDSQPAVPGLQTNSFGAASGNGFDTLGNTIGSVSGTGSAITTVGHCQVAVDKEVSCDGGSTWFDQNAPETANQDGTNGCIAAAVTGQIQFRYRIKNTDATFSVTSCTLSDSNGNVTVPALTGILPVGPGTTTTFVNTSNLACTTANFGGGNQTDTATLSCQCSGAPAGFTASNTATDSAEVGCCGGTLNKQISCDGGSTFHDGTNGPGSPPASCIGVVGANDILAKYVLTSTGTITPTCNPIVDSNATLSTTTPTECVATHNGGEADTATDTCTCSLAGAADFQLSAQSSNNFSCCGVAIDKQVSCSPGVWTDALNASGAPNFVTGNQDGTNSCTAMDGQTVAVRYFVENTGLLPLVCNTPNQGLTDVFNSGGVAFPLTSESVAVSSQIGPIVNGGITTCSQTLNTQEQTGDTASINCTCSDATSGATQTVMASDQAQIQCTPTSSFSATKTCVPTGPTTFSSDVHVISTGEAALNCTVVDQTVSGPCMGTLACPIAGGTPVSLSPPTLMIAAQSAGCDPATTCLSGDFNGSLSSSTTVCNQACVTCNAGTTPVGTMPAQATCTPCSVSVDKQVSCDGGVTFHDVGPNSTDHCIGTNGASDIVVKYITSNTGGANLVNCTLMDSNGGITGFTAPGSILTGAGAVTTTSTTETCSTTLTSSEPDTATVSCECGMAGSGIIATAMDVASFSCPPTGGCPATQGFYNGNHPCRWPTTSSNIDGIQYNGTPRPPTMTIGGITYTQAQLLQIMPNGGLHSGAYANTISQMIAAVLNLAGGSQSPTAVNNALTSLNNLFNGVHILCGATLNTLCTQSASFVSQVESFEPTLDAFNSASAAAGVSACSEGTGLNPGTCTQGGH